MQTDQGASTQDTEEVEFEPEGSGSEELFDIPDDLQDVPDPGAPPADPAADPKGPPAAKPAGAQPRDEIGRYDKKPDAAAPAAGQPPAPAQAAQASTEAPTTDEGEPPEEPELEFSFRADGKVHSIPGARITKDALIVPRDQLPVVQRLLSKGRTYEGSFRQRLEGMAQEVAQVRSEVSEEVERSRAYLNFMADLFDRTERGEMDDQGRTPVEAWLDDFGKNRRTLEAEATLAAAKAIREGRQAPAPRLEGFDDEPADPYLDAQDREQFNNELASELSTRLQGFVQKLEIRGLTPQELSTIHQAMSEPDELDRYYRVALEDVPEHGITKGQIIALDDQIQKRLKYEANLILNARRGAAELRAAEEKNRRNGVGNPIPPTTPASTGKPAAGKAGQMPEFPNTPEGRKQMEEWFAGVDPTS